MGSYTHISDLFYELYHKSSNCAVGLKPSLRISQSIRRGKSRSAFAHHDTSENLGLAELKKKLGSTMTVTFVDFYD